MVQVQREGVVAEHPKRFIVVSVHVANKEVKHCHVHEIQQTAPGVVGWDVPHHCAVV